MLFRSVIAIIGLLASIVLVSLGGARNRAKDARIIGDMGQLRSTSEIFNGNNGTYTGFSANADEDILAADITDQGGTYIIQINTDGLAYCATALLNSAHYWCTDSALHSKDYGTTAPAACVAACVAANTCKCE